MEKTTDYDALVLEGVDRFVHEYSPFLSVLFYEIRDSGKALSDITVDANIDSPDHLFNFLTKNVNGVDYADVFHQSHPTVPKEDVFKYHHVVPAEGEDPIKLTAAWMRLLYDLESRREKLLEYARGLDISEHSHDLYAKVSLEAIRLTNDKEETGEVDVMKLLIDIARSKPEAVRALHVLLHSENGNEFLHTAVAHVEGMIGENDYDEVWAMKKMNDLYISPEGTNNTSIEAIRMRAALAAMFGPRDDE